MISNPPAPIDFMRPVPIGTRFGHLVVVGHGSYGMHRITVVCRCDCGSVFEMPQNDLLFFTPDSCKLKYGRLDTRGLQPQTKHELYHRWKNMISRCKYPKHRAYYRYGGRGIKVCDEWLHSFHEFKLWAVSHGYKKGLDLDRIDNDGNYEPSNCRFVTRRENLKNRGKWIKPHAKCRRAEPITAKEP